MRILLVDDEPFVLRALQRVLRMHAVTSAGSGEEALAKIRGGATFDVILCDLNMPGMSGRDLHAAIDALLPELARRMIFISGGGTSESDRAFLDTQRRLPKPFTPAEVRALFAVRPTNAPSA